MSGTKPNDGTIKVENGQVSTTGTSMKIGDYTVSYDTTKKTYVAKILGILCTKADGDTTTLTTGRIAQTGEVSLIMNMNIDSNGKGTTSSNTVEWPSGGSNHKDENESVQAVTVKEYLQSSTTNWKNLSQGQISLPSAEQIAQAGGDTEWTDSNFTRNTLSSWLYGNLRVNGSAPNAYWTSTPHASLSNRTWSVRYIGDLGVDYVDADVIGVRPVITIPKAQLD